MNTALSVLGLLALSTVASIPTSGPPICAVSVSRTTVVAGEYVAVGWSSSGGLSHTLTNAGLVERSGSHVFQLSAPTRFEFFVQNQYGTCVDTEVVNVTPRTQENDVSVFARLMANLLSGNRSASQGNTSTYYPYSNTNYAPYTTNTIRYYEPSSREIYYPNRTYTPDQGYRDTQQGDERQYVYSPLEDGALHRAGYTPEIATPDAPITNQDPYGPFEPHGPFPEPSVPHVYDVAPMQNGSDWADSYRTQNDYEWANQPGWAADPVPYANDFDQVAPRESVSGGNGSGSFFPERNFATDPDAGTNYFDPPQGFNWGNEDTQGGWNSDYEI